MKKTAIASVLATLLVAPSAFAAGFDGFGVGIDMNLKSTGGDVKNTFTAPNFSDSSSSSVGGDQNVAVGADLHYGFLINPEVLVRIGATATFGTHDIESGSSRSFSDFGGYEASMSSKSSVEESGHYSVYLAPGMLVTENTLVYGKVAYHRMKLKAKDSETYVDPFGETTSSSHSLSKNFSGFGIGAGVETRLTSNLFLSAEVQHVRYSKETLDSTFDADFEESFKRTVQPKSTIGTLGLAYRF